MLRIAAAEDLTALTRLRRAATGDSAEDAAGWLQRVAGLENILLLEKPGAPPALMLAAVPVHYAHHKGIWFTGLAADKGVPADKLLPKLLEGALRAFAENGCDFAVMTPDTAADASHLADLGFKNLLPLRVVSKPIRRNLLAQAQFDSLTVRHLMERRLRCQPGCITLPEVLGGGGQAASLQNAAQLLCRHRLAIVLLVGIAVFDHLCKIHGRIPPYIFADIPYRKYILFAAKFPALYGLSPLCMQKPVLHSGFIKNQTAKADSPPSFPAAPGG